MGRSRLSRTWQRSSHRVSWRGMPERGGPRPRGPRARWDQRGAQDLRGQRAHVAARGWSVPLVHLVQMAQRDPGVSRALWGPEAQRARGPRALLGLRVNQVQQVAWVWQTQVPQDHRGPQVARDQQARQGSKALRARQGSQGHQGPQV